MNKIDILCATLTNPRAFRNVCHADTSAASIPSDGRCSLRPNLTCVAWVIVALATVVFPLERLKIAHVVAPTFRQRFNVINLPTVLLHPSVPAALHTRATSILAKTWIRGLWYSLLPHGFDHPLIEPGSA